MIKFLLFLFLSGIAMAREVQFTWEPMQGALNYDIEVSETEDFKKVLKSGNIQTPEFSATLDFGQYYYRVRATDQKKRTGRWSKPALITVSPYTPELIEPQSGYEVTYSQVLPEILFRWKPIDGKQNYQLLISKGSGQKVLEVTVDGDSYKLNKLPAGEYMWQVKAIVKKTLNSNYSDPRSFKILNDPLPPVEAIVPVENSTETAYHELMFVWKQDPRIKFVDLSYERQPEGLDKGEKKQIANIDSNHYISVFEEPGKYKYSLTGKETKTSPGVGNKPQEFEVRSGAIAKGNYELEFSMSPMMESYSTKSARQTNGQSSIDQSSSSQGNNIGFLGGYYWSRVMGFYFSTRTGNTSIENLTSYTQETDGTFRFRIGSYGFFQDFYFGYRMVDLISAENTPAVKTTQFTTGGPLLGTRFSFAVKKNIRATFNGWYYKPFFNVEGISGLSGDGFGGAIGAKWNFLYQFWVGYRFAYSRFNGAFVKDGASTDVTSNWSYTRLEPIYISLGFEH